MTDVPTNDIPDNVISLEDAKKEREPRIEFRFGEELKVVREVDYNALATGELSLDSEPAQTLLRAVILDLVQRILEEEALGLTDPCTD
jgi:hypothetical protein